MAIKEMLELTGKVFIAFFEAVGNVFNLLLKTVRALFVYKFEFKEFIRQFYFIANRSFLLVSLVAIFTGMVMALQLSVGLSRFGLKTYIGQIVGLAIVRELGPVLTCLMLAARVGSGIAAEIGSMVVTEQVLAIEAMGANPIAKLVVPRAMAAIIAAPLLTAFANVIGIFGGMIITVREAGVNSQYYIDQITSSIVIGDFIGGMVKTVFFGIIVVMVSCQQGLATSGGTEGVGVATTRAVVHSSILIFVSDFFLTKFLLYI